ncbi:MAG: hypothetical protein ACXVRJ_11540 [Gaiellaceae bacterium]
MPRFESLRDRLPSLYRPQDDETVDPLLPLGRDDLAELTGADGAIRFTSTQRDGSLVVNCTKPASVALVRLAPGRAPGSGYALELRTLGRAGSLSLKPFAVLPVHDSVAALGTTTLPATFAVQLKQRSLLTLELLAVADVLERLNREAGEVMQSHWFAYADRALFSPFFLRGRALQGLGLPGPEDPPVRHFPYIDDLGRLASLLSLPPWQEPVVQDGGGSASPETVETYRQRIARIVALYTNGLGTIEALRRMTEAQLPVDVDAAPEQRDRPFDVEELAPLLTVTNAVRLEGQPTDYVGPLMHWPLANDAVVPSPPTAFLQAATEAELAETDPDGEQLFAPAVAPLLELYRGGPLRLGLAYRDTVPTGKTLRIRPAFASWVGLDKGVAGATTLPGDDDADPTAPGPWTAETKGPKAAVTSLVVTSDHTLWAAAAGGELWRYDGAWTKVLTGQPETHCLAEDGLDLLLGTDGGLLRVARFPDGAFAAVAEPNPDGRVVHALLRGGDGTLWAGTSAGLGQYGTGDKFKTTPLKLEVAALATDSTGAIYAGGGFGLAAHRPDANEWWWYSGESASDEDSEWVSFDPSKKSTLPDDAHVFLPAVTALRRAGDGALWIGTEQGLARYVARGEGGPVAFRTLLEAFPDLCPGRVDALVEDERGLLCACTDRGFLRYDGRDWFQFQATGPGFVQLGRADSLYPPGAEPIARGAWRFRRAGNAWERFDTTLASPGFVAFGGDPRTTAEPAVYALAFTDSLAADIVDTWDPGDFGVSGSTPVDPARFVMRVKVDGDTRVVDGGIPALPRVPPGASEWRYLSLEPEKATLPTGRPAWTIEGRLLPAEKPAPDPEPGRYDQGLPDPQDEESEYDEAVFAFPPAARIGLSWEPKRPLSVLVRLGKRGPSDSIDPAALDRVFAGMQQVRPAGVRAVLAIEERRVRKET